MEYYRSVTVTTSFGTRDLDRVYLDDRNGTLRVYKQEHGTTRLGDLVLIATAPWEVSFA
jgi:hypothetical protein